MIYYISGLISNGCEQKPTFKGFYEAEEMLLKREDCTGVFNPAKLEKTGATWEYYMTRDLLFIIENNPTMYMLQGWEQSKGARLEHEVAKELGPETEYELLADS